ncbi:MAG: twin-arginine translocase TatA/TatE family subunit [Actinomycetota bacterium]|nr:twin-arginine translocase TatA/TatE family subunit [Actinomycetota bacterium]
MHLLVIFVIALIVLGPEKMPDAMRKGARLLGEARQWSARISEELQSVVSVQTQNMSAPAPEAPTALPGAEADDASPTTTVASQTPPPPGLEPVSDGADAADRCPAPSATGPVDHPDRPPPFPEEHHL